MKYKLEVEYDLVGDVEENLYKIYQSQYGDNFISHDKIRVSCENGYEISITREDKVN